MIVEKTHTKNKIERKQEKVCKDAFAKHIRIEGLHEHSDYVEFRSSV